MKSFVPVLLAAVMALSVHTLALPLDYDVLAKRSPDAEPEPCTRGTCPAPQVKREAAPELEERRWPPDWKREAVPDLEERRWPPDWRREAEPEPEPEVKKRDAEPGCGTHCI